MNAADQFHVGIVVDALDAALHELGASLGHEWGPEVDVEQQVHLPSGERTIRFHFRYSRTEPRIEVIQAQPDTLWVPTGGAGHHVGLWSDDLAADGAALEGAGWEWEAASAADPAERMWSYHRGPSGLRVELVSRSMQDLMAGLWA